MLDALAAAVAHETAWHTIVMGVVDAKAAAAELVKPLVEAEQEQAILAEDIGGRRFRGDEVSDLLLRKHAEASQRVDEARRAYEAAKDRIIDAQAAMKAGVQ